MTCFNSRCIQRQIRGKVLLLASGEVLVYEYQDFEDDSLFNTKPVKRFLDWSDMRIYGSLRDQACQTILEILEPCDILGIQITKQRIEIIQSSMNIGSFT